MTDAHRRQKQPDLIRGQLLAVARELLVGEGPQAVTLDAVSARAGVTKGGLQHHFRSKQALLEALSDQLSDEFTQCYEEALAAEPPTPGRAARAYIRTCFEDVGGDSLQRQRAIGQLALSLPRCREHWSALMRAALTEDGADPGVADRLLLCRLAADGFWFTQMLEVYPLDDDRRSRLQALLLGLCNEAVK